MTLTRAMTLSIAIVLAPMSLAQTPAADAPANQLVAVREPHPVLREAELGGVSARLTAPTDRTEVGAPIEFTLAAMAPSDIALTLPEIATEFGPFETRELRKSSQRKDGQATYIIKFTASTYASGEQTTPPLTVAWNDAAGKEQKLEIAGVAIEVASLVGETFDPAKYRDIKGPVDIEVGRSWWWLVAVVALGIAAAGVWMLWKRRRALELMALTPDQWALGELARLESDNLVGRGDLHAYWVRLSDIVRQYIERRFEIAAPEQTTKEFLASAGDHPMIGAEHRHLLTDFLRAADMVKFAAYRPAESDCTRGLEAARGFVSETTPVEGALSEAKEEVEVRT